MSVSDIKEKFQYNGKPKQKGFTMSKSIAKIFNISTVDFDREMKWLEGENCLSSLFIAKAFGKRPAHVIRDIEVAIGVRERLYDRKDQPKLGLVSKEKFVRKFYKLASYLARNGEMRKKYFLTERGFFNVCVQYKGDLAEEVRELLIENYIAQRTIVAKNKLLAEVLAEIPQYVNARKESKKVRKTLTDAVNETVVLYRINEENRKGDGWFFKSYTNLIYKSMGLKAPKKGVNTRDTLTQVQLEEISILEDKVTSLMYMHEENGTHYKETYQLIKAELL